MFACLFAFGSRARRYQRGRSVTVEWNRLDRSRNSHWSSGRFPPGKPVANGGPDDDDNSASVVVPAQVYMGTAAATTNGFRVLEHAERVASIMLSTDSNAIGVSTGARLPSGGYAATADLSQQRIALTMNRIATLTAPVINEEVSAINFSENIALDGGEALDGASHLSQFIDWPAVQHDVLYVVG